MSTPTTGRRRRSRLVALAAALALSAVLTTPAYASPTKSWDLTQEFANHPKVNPFSGKYGAAWSWMYGVADTPSTFALMEDRIHPPQTRKECGPAVGQIYLWTKSPRNGTTTPAVFYNAGAAIEEGQSACAPLAHYPAKTAFMHPEAFTGSDYAVAGWKSPITGVVTVTGSVQPVDSGVTGIVWELDRESTIVAGPAEQLTNSLTTFGPLTISVTAGESIYLEIGPGASGGGGFDSTAVTLHIHT